ncbi:aromatic acid exporter family protein [Bacillus sp. CGMCC 1.16607]|uniref:FUSC family protein n=1 Tax=Bacillus sp. CGMCC 1.16607 TaxID=3351842 RepID=UPI003636E9D2
MTLGPRILKTGISVTLALFICTIFNLEPAVFAGVAAIFTIQPSIYRSWKQVLDQLKTNTLGAAIALFMIYFIGRDPFTIGIVMIIVIMICMKMKMESSISLTLVTVLAIMGAHGTANEDFLFAVNRFGIILIGMASAFLVNLLILPPKYKNIYRDKVHSVFQNMSLLMRTAISNEMTEKSFQEDTEKLKEDIKRLEELFNILDEERVKMAKLNPQDIRELVVFKQMLKTAQQGSEVLYVIEEHYFQSANDEQENELFDQQLEELIRYNELILLKYDQKLKKEEDLTESIISDCGLFLEKIMDIYREDRGQKLRLVVIGSSIFEYAFQLKRLDQLTDQYLKKVLK